MSQTMESDAFRSAPPISPNRKRSYYAQEEDIEIKPSTELIPDEYEHGTNNEVSLHIFKTSVDDYIAEDLLETLQKIDYNINRQTHLHDLNTTKDFLQDLENIKKETENKSALLLVFIGFFDINCESGTLLMMEERCSVPLKTVWNIFTSNNCPELKQKPKIFLFYTSPEFPAQIQTDSMRHRTVQFDQVYDFPAESDILIVYNQINETMSTYKEIFLTQLCANITTYSKKYDIIDLVSYLIPSNKFSPLVVSTLTRKFYLTPSKDREHYLTLNENQNNLEKSLEKIQEDLEKLSEIQKKKKDRSFFSSFRMKSEDKPKVTKKSNDKSKDAEKTQIPKTEEPKPSKRISAPLSPRPRLSSAGPSGGIRSRNPSESDSGIGKKKPIWKL